GKISVRVGRVYDNPAADGGARVLVDRIWPRGLAKAEARLDEWCKALAPSTELRTWYGHDPERFAEFARRYRAEVRQSDRADALADLGGLSARQGGLTLLTATRRTEISAAEVLAELIAE